MRPVPQRVELGDKAKPMVGMPVSQHCTCGCGPGPLSPGCYLEPGIAAYSAGCWLGCKPLCICIAFRSVGRKGAAHRKQTAFPAPSQLVLGPRKPCFCGSYNSWLSSSSWLVGLQAFGLVE